MRPPRLLQHHLQVVAPPVHELPYAAVQQRHPQAEDGAHLPACRRHQAVGHQEVGLQRHRLRRADLQRLPDVPPGLQGPHDALVAEHALQLAHQGEDHLGVAVGDDDDDEGPERALGGGAGDVEGALGLVQDAFQGVPVHEDDVLEHELLNEVDVQPELALQADVLLLLLLFLMLLLLLFLHRPVLVDRPPGQHLSQVFFGLLLLLLLLHRMFAMPRSELSLPGLAPRPVVHLHRPPAVDALLGVAAAEAELLLRGGVVSVHRPAAPGEFLAAVAASAPVVPVKVVLFSAALLVDDDVPGRLHRASAPLIPLVTLSAAAGLLLFLVARPLDRRRSRVAARRRRRRRLVTCWRRLLVLLLPPIFWLLLKLWLLLLWILLLPVLLLLLLLLLLHLRRRLGHLVLLEDLDLRLCLC